MMEFIKKYKLLLSVLTLVGMLSTASTAVLITMNTAKANSTNIKEQAKIFIEIREVLAGLKSDLYHMKEELNKLSDHLEHKQQ